MSYGYNPTAAKVESYQATPRIVDSIQFIAAADNKAPLRKNTKEPEKGVRKSYRPSRIVSSYVHTIERRIEFVNQDLLRKKRPYRFQIRKSKKTFIDMEVLDNDGNIERIHSKEITESNYKSILDNLSSGEGFIFED